MQWYLQVTQYLIVEKKNSVPCQGTFTTMTHCVLPREVPHPLEHTLDGVLVMADVVGVVADVITIPENNVSI